MKTFFVDGACSGNPGPGGYGVVCIEGNEVIYSHSEYMEAPNKTTNNREELKAILHVFQLVSGNPEFRDVIIYSDSAYCVNMLNNWIYTWANNDWKNSKKQQVENTDLVKQLYKYLNTEFFPCQVVKVNGHCGVIANELADALATKNKAKYIRILKENEIIDSSIEITKKL